MYTCITCWCGLQITYSVIEDQPLLLLSRELRDDKDLNNWTALPGEKAQNWLSLCNSGVCSKSFNTLFQPLIIALYLVLT